MCVLSILMFPSMVIRYNMGWYEMLLIDVPLFFAATFSFCNFYMVCQREIHTDWLARLKYVPFLMSVGIGLSINNTRAVFEALFNKQSEFARTPKYRIEGDADEWVGKRYRQSVAVQPLIELALGLYFTATVFYALANQIYGTLPFLVLFQVGFLYTGLLSIVQQYAGRSGRAQDPGGQWQMKSRSPSSGSSADTILSDIDRLVDSPASRRALAAGKTTILKDNISWHFPFPAANTTPWQLEGTIQALARRGFTDQVCVQNKTVVTNAFKGEDLNHYVPIFKQYDIPVLYNFKDEDMTWVPLQAEGADARARPHLPGRHSHPRLLLRQEHRPPADDQVPHLHDDDRRDEERVRRAAEHAAALHAFVDPRDAGRPAGDPEGDPLGPVRDHGRHDGRQRPRPADDVSGREERDAGLGRPGGDRRGGGEDDGLRSDVARVHPAGARGRPRRRRSARDRDRRRHRRGERELALPRRQEPGPASAAAI